MKDGDYLKILVSIYLLAYKTEYSWSIHLNQITVLSKTIFLNVCTQHGWAIKQGSATNKIITDYLKANKQIM